MAIEDDDKPRKKITHEIGQDLSLLSVEELTERIALMNSEIERLQQAAQPGHREASTAQIREDHQLEELDRGVAPFGEPAALGAPALGLPNSATA